MVVWTAASHASAAPGLCTLSQARKPWRALSSTQTQCCGFFRHSLTQPSRGRCGVCSRSSEVRCSAEGDVPRAMYSQHMSRRTLGLCAASVALCVSFNCAAQAQRPDLASRVSSVGLQISQSAQARNSNSYDLAASGQQVSQYAFA